MPGTGVIVSADPEKKTDMVGFLLSFDQLSAATSDIVEVSVTAPFNAATTATAEWTGTVVRGLSSSAMEVTAPVGIATAAVAGEFTRALSFRSQSKREAEGLQDHSHARAATTLQAVFRGNATRSITKSTSSKDTYEPKAVSTSVKGLSSQSEMLPLLVGAAIIGLLLMLFLHSVSVLEAPVQYAETSQSLKSPMKFPLKLPLKLLKLGVKKATVVS